MMLLSRVFAFIRGSILVLLALPLSAAVDGVVINGTTGRQESGVEVTLIKLEQGMMPIGSTKTDAYGKFRFPQDVTGGGGQASPIMLRAVFEGVVYNQMIPPGMRSSDVRVTVYRAASAATPAAAPRQRIMVLEPSGGQMIVNEFFLFQNRSQPPVTYADARQGTLRFYLPAAAKGVVQASAAGPGGMPIRAAAEKADQRDVYKINFPIKPGESRIEVTYLVPYQSPMGFDVRTLYEGLVTRLAAPAGVTLAGGGLQPLPENPQLKASIFQVPEAPSFSLSISGEGRMARESSQGEGQSGDSISIIPAAVDGQLWQILGFSGGILALGFYALYTAGPRAEPSPERRKSEPPRGKRKA